MDKRFWGILIGIAIAFGVIVFITGHKANAPSTTTKPTSHIEGEGKDGVTLLEYGDYQCPFCGQFYPIVKQVQAEYNTQIFFQFRNLPLIQLHQNAFAGARAAEAASLQGKFWQMHDTLYDNQDPSGAQGWVASSDPLDDYFVGFAQQIGLNVATFKTDYASDQVNNSINADVSAFDKTGEQEATPSFFLDGTYISPTESVSSFETFINAEIKKKGFTPPASTSTSTPTTGSTPQSTQ
jgi:protein-disulfide isomerase